MPEIQVLAPHIADLIAAGEVVERPASVVKELMENAIDAGAKALTVEIQNGGMSLIRVTDDGCGIPADQLETAFLRHATSKLRSALDLEAIGTLGFRGEALAAIAAVSRVEVLTRTADEDLGAALTVEGGTVLAKEEAGCPQGTTMLVRDLFYNTPARLKFMKKDTAEGAAAFAAVQRLALAHPEVSVKFIREGRQELLTPGDGDRRGALYAVLGREVALGMTPVKGTGEEGMTVEGFASIPTCCRGSRSLQFFFVNGRHIKSRTLTAALEEAYRNQRMVGKFPGCVLYLTTRLNAVDVNVHPAKTEVKFVSEKRAFDGVYYAVKGALEAGQTRPQAIPKPASHDTVTPNQTAFRHMTAREYRAQGAPPSPPAYSPAAPSRPALTLHDVAAEGKPVTLPARDGVRRQVTKITPPGETKPILSSSPTAPAVSAISAPAPGPRPQPEPAPTPAPAEPPAAPESEPWVIRGELFHTYILVEQGDRAYYIDKHAAHERMNFDKLKSAGYTPMVQRLLTPAVVTPSPEETAALLENLPLLAQFGFECEDFGGGSLVVRQAPDYVDPGELETVLTELGAALSSGRADPQSARDHVMATMACKAAVKGGQRNDPKELERVAQAVMDGRVKYCPHGRPVAVELTKKELEKLFKRI